MNSKWLCILTILGCGLFFSSNIGNAQIINKNYSNQISIGFGSSQQVGDINSLISKSYSLSFSGNHSISNLLSLKLGGHYSSNTGLDVFPRINLSDFPDIISSAYNDSNPYFTAYNSKVYHVDFGIQIELSNLALEKYRWLNYYVGMSVGFYTWNTRYDLLDENGAAYSNLIERLGFNSSSTDTRKGRSDLRKRIIETFDGTFETPGPKREGLFRLGDETNILNHLSVFAGADFRISNRFNLGLIYDFRLSTNDLLDGFANDAEGRRTGFDQLHSLQIRFGYRFGKSKARKDVWVNPWQSVTDSLLLARKELDSLLNDDDKDGVVNKFDLEPFSSLDCEVDKQGRNIDENQNGILDCLEKSNISSNLLNQKIKQLENKLNNLAESYDSALKSLQDSILSLQNSSHEHLAEFRHIVYFDHDGFELTEMEVKDLERFIFTTRQSFDIEEIRLSGYASSPGSAEMNDRLVDRRLNVILPILKNELPESAVVIELLNKGEIESSSQYLARKVEIVLKGKF